MKHAICLLLLLVLLPGLPGQETQVNAQAGGSVQINAPELDQFPTIRFYLSAYDTEGGFIDDLQMSEVEIVEDRQVLQPSQVEAIDAGLQTIIALNISPSLATQASGVPEYQRLQQSLLDWASSQKASGLDDFSLATPTGLFLIRSKDPQQLNQALSEYQPDLLQLQPSLNSLAESLDLATDPLDSPLARRAILYITPPLLGNNEKSLTDMTTRAQEIGVQVSVWLMSADTLSAQSTPAPLQLMAEATGGKFFQVAPTDPLPEIEPLFDPLRHIYQVEYGSEIRTSGTHTLQVNIRRGATQLSSNEQRFDVNVQPPNPIFLDPPATIQRSWAATGNNSAAPSLSPEEVNLQILVEFPDQHPRALTATRLYVNDELIVENSAEPFDRFTWTVGDLVTPTSLLLRVEADDSLGLRGSSAEVPVQILVDQPAKTSLYNRFSKRGIVAVSAIAVSGIALALVLALTGSRRTRRRRLSSNAHKRVKDPVTQPVNILAAPTRKETSRPSKKRGPAGLAIPLWPQSGGQTNPARMVVLDENEQPITGGSIPLSRQEITFGNDPQRATHVLNSPTVDSLHARLFRSPKGDFILADEDSVAGTWVNYAPVTVGGAHLEHGDIIHIGKVMFRFEITDPARIPSVEPRVTDLDTPI